MFIDLTCYPVFSSLSMDTVFLCMYPSALLVLPLLQTKSYTHHMPYASQACTTSPLFRMCTVQAPARTASMYFPPLPGRLDYQGQHLERSRQRTCLGVRKPPVFTWNWNRLQNLHGSTQFLSHFRYSIVGGNILYASISHTIIFQVWSACGSIKFATIRLVLSSAHLLICHIVTPLLASSKLNTQSRISDCYRCADPSCSHSIL